jgi:Flp pilus assembly pilin Flp
MTASLHRPGARPRRSDSLLARARTALADDSGAATAEYAIATLAAVGLAGLLVTILRGDEVRGMLADLVRRALSAG